MTWGKHTMFGGVGACQEKHGMFIPTQHTARHRRTDKG